MQRLIESAQWRRIKVSSRFARQACWLSFFQALKLTRCQVHFFCLAILASLQLGFSTPAQASVPAVRVWQICDECGRQSTALAMCQSWTIKYPSLTFTSLTLNVTGTSATCYYSYNGGDY